MTCRGGFADPHAAEQLAELAGRVAVGGDRARRPPIFGKPGNVCVRQRHHSRVEPDRVRRAAGRAALGQGLDQSVLGELAVLVVFVGRAAALDDSRHAIGSR